MTQTFLRSFLWFSHKLLLISSTVVSLRLDFLPNLIIQTKDAKASFSYTRIKARVCYSLFHVQQYAGFVCLEESNYSISGVRQCSYSVQLGLLEVHVQRDRTYKDGFPFFKINLTSNSTLNKNHFSISSNTNLFLITISYQKVGTRTFIYKNLDNNHFPEPQHALWPNEDAKLSSVPPTDPQILIEVGRRKLPPVDISRRPHKVRQLDLRDFKRRHARQTTSRLYNRFLQSNADVRPPWANGSNEFQHGRKIRTTKRSLSSKCFIQ